MHEEGPGKGKAIPSGAARMRMKGVWTGGGGCFLSVTVLLESTPTALEHRWGCEQRGRWIQVSRLCSFHLTSLHFYTRASARFLDPNVLSGCLNSGSSNAPQVAWQTATHHLPRREGPCAHAPRLLSSHHQFWSVEQSENIVRRSGSLPTCLRNYWSNRPEHISYYRHLQRTLQRGKNIVNCIRKMSHDTSLQWQTNTVTFIFYFFLRSMVNYFKIWNAKINVFYVLR